MNRGSIDFLPSLLRIVEGLTNVKILPINSEMKLKFENMCIYLKSYLYLLADRLDNLTAT